MKDITHVTSVALPQIAELLSYFAGLPSVRFACLFGSHARGQANALSDVDIAVLLDKSLDKNQRFDLRLDMTADVSRILRTNDVDIAVLNDTPVALSYRVVRDGILLFCRDRDEMVAYCARILSEYFDFLPVLQLFEKATLERARRGELSSGYNPYLDSFERHRRHRESLKGNAENVAR